MAGFYKLNCIDELEGFLKMRLRTIKDIGQVVSGSTPSRDKPEFWGGSIPWVTPKELSALSSPFLNDSVEKITELGYKSCSATMLPKRSVLFSSRAPIGLVAVATLPVCTNQGFKSIIPKDDVDALYLYYALKHHKRQLNALGTGTTFKELSKNTFEKFALPFPDDLQAQRQIAHLLSRAEELIASRQRSLALLDDFLKSTFLELFGDPVKNEKGWEVDRLGDNLERIDGGWSPVCLDEVKEDDSDWAVLKLGAVTSRYFKPNENKKLPPDLTPRPSIEVKGGDLLFSRKNTHELVGAAAYVFDTPPGLMMSDTIFRLVNNQHKLKGHYLAYLLNDSKFRKSVQALASGSAGSMPNISKERLSNLRIPLPNPDLQTCFAEIVNHVETLKTRQKESLAQLQNLYQSLLQRAFSGQLDVSGVRLPEAEPRPASRRVNQRNSDRKLKLHSNVAHKREMEREETTDPPSTSSQPSLAERVLTWFSVQELGRIPFDVVNQSFTEVSYEQLRDCITEQLQVGKLTQEFDPELDGKDRPGRIKLLLNQSV